MSKSRTDKVIEQAETMVKILENLIGSSSVLKVQRDNELQRIDRSIDSIDNRLRKIEQNDREAQAMPDPWQSMATHHDAPAYLQ